jgi:hypothetical protein
LSSARPLAIGLLAILAVVGACAGPAPEPSHPLEAVAPAPGAATVPRCEDVPNISAPADVYRETPVYVGNEMPVEAVRDWAVQQPGYVDIWIDRTHSGWVTVAFSQDAAARQAELEREFPDAGVVAVAVEHGPGELEALQRRVHEVLPPDVAGGSAVLTMQGVVMIGAGVLTPERIALIESQFAGQPVCLEGADPADLPAPGPQQPAGDGWRLLATEPTGQPYRTGIAWDAASLADLWVDAGITADVPVVDFQTEVVIWFGAVVSGSCPDVRLDDVVIDGSRRVIHADIVLPDPPMACTSDANPHAFLVAVPRSRLPAPTFAIQLGPEDPPGGAPEERTLVEADLRVPGSIAEAGQIHEDPALTQPEPQFVQSGDTIESEVSQLYLMSVHCGIEWLGTLNGLTWRAEVPDGVVDWVPPAWQQVVAPDESIILEIEMSPGPDPIVTASANDHVVVYRPVPEPAPGCD